MSGEYMNADPFAANALAAAERLLEGISAGMEMSALGARDTLGAIGTLEKAMRSLAFQVNCASQQTEQKQ